MTGRVLACSVRASRGRCEPGTHPRDEHHPRAADRTRAVRPVGSDGGPRDGPEPPGLRRGFAKARGREADRVSWVVLRPVRPNGVHHRRGVSLQQAALKRRSTEDRWPAIATRLNLPATEFPMKSGSGAPRARAAELVARARPLAAQLRARRARSPAVAAARRPALFERASPCRARRPTRSGRTRVRSRRDAALVRRALRPGLGQPRHADRDAGRQGVRAQRARSPTGSTLRRAAASTRPSGSTSSARSSSASACGASGSIPTSRWITAFEAAILDDVRRTRSDDGFIQRGLRSDPLVPHRLAPRSPRPRSSTRTIRRRRSCVAFPLRFRSARRAGAPAGGDGVDARRRGRCPRTAGLMVDPDADVRGRRDARRGARCVGRGARRPRCGGRGLERRRRSRARQGPRACSGSSLGAVGQRLARRRRHAVREPRGRHRPRAHGPGPRQGGLRGRPAARASRSSCPVDEAGRFTAGAEPFVGRSVLEVNDDIIALARRERGRAAARRHASRTLPALLALPPAGDLPRHQPVVHDRRPSTDHRRALPRPRSSRRCAGIRRRRRTASASRCARRPDWCLSRQRAWGVGIPALYCEACDDTRSSTPA